MKYCFFLLSFFIAGCNHPTSDKKMQIYYGTPKLEGIISIDSDTQALINTPIFLLTSCNDQQAITDYAGYFNFPNDCKELIPIVNINELGYLYKVIVSVNNEDYIWTISGLGYGIQKITALINLTTKTVVYRVDDGIKPIHEKISELIPLLSN